MIPTGPTPAAVANHFQHPQFLVALGEVQNFLPAFVAVFDHPVEIYAQEIRLHAAEHLGKARDVIVAVMKVVDDADVRDAVALQFAQ